MLSRDILKWLGQHLAQHISVDDQDADAYLDRLAHELSVKIAVRNEVRELSK